MNKNFKKKIAILSAVLSICSARNFGEQKNVLNKHRDEGLMF